VIGKKMKRNKETKMTFEEFKSEYTKREVVINDIKFTINKLPAIKGAFIFTGLIKKLFGDISTIDLGNSNGETVRAIILGLIAGLDIDYLENELTPTLFNAMVYSYESRNLKNLNFKDCKVSIEDMLKFDDILELIIRGICVNFLNAISERGSKLLSKK
jgi:hypothetical protein